MEEPKEFSFDPYINLSKEAKPRKLLQAALEYVSGRENALDLGSGALNDSKYLLDQGFEHVDAVDIEPVVAELAEKIQNSKLTAHIVSFDQFSFSENKYDIVNAQHSLPFTKVGTLEEVINKISYSLKQNGIFVGHLFGQNNQYLSGEPHAELVTKEQIEEMFRKFEIILCREDEYDGPKASGTIKHWHKFSIIARKK